MLLAVVVHVRECVFVSACTRIWAHVYVSICELKINRLGRMCVRIFTEYACVDLLSVCASRRAQVCAQYRFKDSEQCISCAKANLHKSG